MKRPEIHQNINLILDKMVKRNRSLMTESGDITPLDVEMLKKLSIELYDAVLSLFEVDLEPISKIEEVEVIAPIVPEVKLPEKEIVVEPEPVIEPIPEIEVPPIVEEKVAIKEPVEVISEKVIEVPEIEPEIKLAPVAKIKFPQEIEPEFENTFKTEPPIQEPVINTPPESVIPKPDPVVEIETPKIKPESGPIEMKTGSIHDLAAKNFVSIEEKVVQNHKPVHKPVSTDKSVLDKLSENEVKPTVHDVTKSSKTEKVLSETFLNFRISRIVDAIDISKRFELQNNLFGRDPQVYLNAIQTLEKSANLSEAMNHFNTFGKNYHWDFKDELVEELKSFIQRKYQE